MLNIVATSGSIGSLKANQVFATWNDLPPKDVLAFSAALGRTWLLPELSQTEKSDLLDRYVKLVDDIGMENDPKGVWWYTWTSSRDRTHSKILSDMELLVRFQNACDGDIPEGLVVLCPDPVLADSLTSIARQNGIETHTTVGDRCWWARRRLRMALAPFVGSLKISIKALLGKHRRSGIGIPGDETKRASERILLVSWLRTTNLEADGPIDDTYFGRLPEAMANKDRSVVIFGDVLEAVPPRLAKQDSTPDIPVVAMVGFLTYWAIIAAFIRGMFSVLSVKKTLHDEDYRLIPLVKQDIHANRSTAVYCSLMESALLKYSKEYRPTKIIHACENNPWERTCSQVAATIIPQPEVVGFMHCAALLSHTKILITDKGKQFRPRPNKIVCTGAKSRDIMIRYGGHSPEETFAGYALRHEYLKDVQPRKSIHQPIRKILVVLEGLPSMAAFMRMVYDGLKNSSGLLITIRPHPAYLIENILFDSGLTGKINGIFKLSEHQAMKDDFDDADLLIYKGSTTAFEAGYFGLPLIHVDDQGLLTDDPLFEISAFKRVVRTSAELVPAIQEFSQMGDDQFRYEADLLRAYVEDYLTMPTGEFQAPFLTNR